jgi:hypothetical protein
MQKSMLALFLLLLSLLALFPVTAHAKPAWDIASLPGEAPDEWGLTPSDWLVLTDEMLIGKARLWEKFPRLMDGVRNKDIKATTLWVTVMDRYGSMSLMAGVDCGRYELFNSYPIVAVDKRCNGPRSGGEAPYVPEEGTLNALAFDSRLEFDARYPNSIEKWPYGPFAMDTIALLFNSDFPRAWWPFRERLWTLDKRVPQKWRGITMHDGKDTVRLMLELHRRGVVPATIELARYCSENNIADELLDFCKNEEAILQNAMDRGSGAAVVPLVRRIVRTEVDVTTPKFQQVPAIFERAIKMGFWPGELLDTNGGWYDNNGNHKGAAFVSKDATLGFIKSYSLATGMKETNEIRYIGEEMDKNVAAFARQEARRTLRGPVVAKEALAPNISTVSAAIMHELQFALHNDPKYQFTRYLETSSAVGAGSKLVERWDFPEGAATLSVGGVENMGSYSYYAFDVSNVKCTKAPGVPTSYDCAFNAGLYVNQRLGPVTLIDQAFPAAPVQLRLQWAGDHWGSPALRTKFMQGSATSGPASTSTGQSQLCRSLNAGMAAAGGQTEHRALNPQTWGC